MTSAILDALIVIAGAAAIAAGARQSAPELIPVPVRSDEDQARQ
ncbi:MAG: hypothetical protein AAF528_12185 [Cyanobacteria bacterium P01_C01_bin.121]